MMRLFGNLLLIGYAIAIPWVMGSGWITWNCIQWRGVGAVLAVLSVGIVAMSLKAAK